MAETVPAKYGRLVEAIEQGDVEAGVAEATRLADGGTPALAIFGECIEPTLRLVGDRFSRLEIFLPELVGSADVVKCVQAELSPRLHAGQARSARGRVVIATVAGDLHDIGKNIVKAMLAVNGFEVKDLGVGVAAHDIVRSAGEFAADIIALSALMLPSLPYMRDTIELARASEATRRRCKIMVGGGPVTPDWAQRAGADGYGDDAVEAVRVALELVGARQ